MRLPRRSRAAGVGGLSLSWRELRLGKPAALQRNVVLTRTDWSQILQHQESVAFCSL